MRSATGRSLLSLGVALTLAACASPESECRAGVAQMKKRMEGYIGQHQDPNNPAVQAYTQFGIAEAQMATGNYEGCNATLAEVAALLRRAQGNNQQ